LAEKTDLSYDYISQIESLKKKKSFSILVLGRIADALELDIRLFFEECSDYEILKLINMKKGDDFIMNIDKAYQILNNYTRKYNLSDNKLLNDILEKIYKSNFIIVGEKEIIHTSKKYDKYKGKEPSEYVKNLIKNKNTGGGRFTFEIISGSSIHGPFMYNFIQQGKTKGLFIFKYNDEYFNSDDLDILHKLYDYIRLY